MTAKIDSRQDYSIVNMDERTLNWEIVESLNQVLWGFLTWFLLQKFFNSYCT